MEKTTSSFPKWDFGKPEAPTTPAETLPESETETPAAEGVSTPKAETGDLPTMQTSTRQVDPAFWWKTLMAFVTEKKVTDILFNPEKRDVFCRINTALEVYQTVGKEAYDKLILYAATEEKKADLEEKGEVDFATTTFGRRMRVNVFKTLKGLAGAYRPLPNKAINWKENGLTQEMMYVIDNTKQGLVLVTGPTGSGKSTTIVSMLEYVNERHPYHIISIEDPIEYIFTNNRCAIDQREVADHTGSFSSALRASLRENPDIIFVGEIRDYETARVALMAADTGHLVFGTLHTRRVYATISRLLEMAPESNREEIRAMLSSALAMVICQRLLQKKGGGIWPAREVMMLNPAIANMIKEKKERGIGNQLLINQTKGMMEWGKALEIAVASGKISEAEAEKFRDTTEDVD